MAIRISVSQDTSQPSSSPLRVLHNVFRPKQGIGKQETASPLIPANTRKLLYFRNKGCVACGIINMQIVWFCKNAGLDLVIVDRWPHEGVPTQKVPYEDELGNVLDADGSIGDAYNVAIYPTFVYVDELGNIQNRQAGINKRDSEAVERFLETFVAPA